MRINRPICKQNVRIAKMMDGMSMNLEQANMDKLRAVFPECFAEGKLDIDKLLALCGE